jgi:hypothetical protein
MLSVHLGLSIEPPEGAARGGRWSEGGAGHILHCHHGGTVGRKPASLTYSGVKGVGCRM